MAQTARPRRSEALGRIAMANHLHKTHTSDLMSRPRVFGRYALVFVYAGEGWYSDVAGFSRPVGAGDLILVVPELAHRYGPGPGQSWREYYLAFEGEAFDLWRRRGLLEPDPPVRRLEPVDAWLRRFEAVLEQPKRLREPIDQPSAQTLAEVCRLQCLLADALHAPSAQTTPGPTAEPAGESDRLWLAQAKALLEAEPEQPLELESVARSLHCSYAGFRRRFRRLAGQPPGRYRMARRVEAACELMQRSDLSDQEIARRLGFCDEAHFSKRFKALVGRSPRAYRKAIPG